MRPQHLARPACKVSQIEALPSQTRRLIDTGYASSPLSTMVQTRNTEVSLNSETGRVRQYNNARPPYSNRRLRCQRASNSWQPLVLLPLCPHVRPDSQTRNSSWLSPSPSQLSQHTPANTSKRNLGQASASAPHRSLIAISMGVH